MKIRRLHEIDLARITTRSENIQKRELRRQKSGYAPFSYNPLRKNFTNIMDAKPPMFPEAESLELSEIIELIRKDSKRGDVEFEQNKILAELLFGSFRKPNIRCVQRDFYPVIIGMGHNVSYWANCILVINDTPHIVFFDQRRQKGLNSQGMKFVFSMMHHHIREQFADLQNAGLLIGQFPNCGDERSLVIHTHGDEELFSFGELNAMISRTYDIWSQILVDREEDTRREDTPLGPLFG